MGSALSAPPRATEVRAQTSAACPRLRPPVALHAPSRLSLHRNWHEKGARSLRSRSRSAGSSVLPAAPVEVRPTGDPGEEPQYRRLIGTGDRQFTALLRSAEKSWIVSPGRRNPAIRPRVLGGEAAADILVPIGQRESRPGALWPGWTLSSFASGVGALSAPSITNELCARCVPTAPNRSKRSYTHPNNRAT